MSRFRGNVAMSANAVGANFGGESVLGARGVDVGGTGFGGAVAVPPRDELKVLKF